MSTYESNDKVCDLKMGLLSMYGFMGIQKYIAQVDKDWGHEQGVIVMYVKLSHYTGKMM